MCPDFTDEVKKISLRDGVDYYVLEREGKVIHLPYKEIESKDKILGKTVLTYKDGQLNCSYINYIPFHFGKYYQITDMFDGMVYKYRILSFENGEFAFDSPNNKKFSSLNQALIAFDKCSSLPKVDREFNLFK